jgi:hypothetical protein
MSEGRDGEPFIGGLRAFIVAAVPARIACNQGRRSALLTGLGPGCQEMPPVSHTNQNLGIVGLGMDAVLANNALAKGFGVAGDALDGACIMLGGEDEPVGNSGSKAP